MKSLRPVFLVFLVGALATAFLFASKEARAETPDNLNSDADLALHMIVTTNPVAADISKQAKAVLIFPKIIKAGLIFGGAYGEGVMKKESQFDGYYNSVTVSLGLQAGAQSYGYIVFLISDKAVEYIHKTHGWEFGTGPTVVVLNKGAGKNLSTTSLKDDAYAFIFNQQGLMASVSLEGTKISQIRNP